MLRSTSVSRDSHSKAAVSFACSVLAMLVTSFAAATPTPAFKIETRVPGVYRVTYEELTIEGAEPGPWRTSKLALANRGDAVPIWIDDGGDKQFGPGDSFEFVAQVLAGEYSFYHPYADANVYILRVDGGKRSRMRAVDGERRPPGSSIRPLSASRHFEVDTLFMRFPARENVRELWHWHKFAPTDPEPFSHLFELDDWARDEGEAVEIAIQLRGWSNLSTRPDESVLDHVLEAELNGRPIATKSWNGKGQHTWRLSVPASRLVTGDNTLTLRTPKRRDDEGRMLVDVVLLNWIQVDYTKSPRLVPDRQQRFAVDDGGRRIQLELPGRPEAWRIYGSDGTRAVFTPNGAEGPMAIEFRAKRRERSFVAATDESLRAPDRVLPLRGREWPRDRAQADYIMIVHPSLRASAEPLAEFRRSAGLTVKVIETDEIYDAFNYGIEDPAAIRAFLSHAYHAWRAPAPRFVLLVGDASWDSKHERTQTSHYAFKPIPLRDLGVGRPEGSEYESAERNSRGLVPTRNYLGGSGHSASDNWFVSVDGDDSLPDMAIGRLPVTTPHEVSAIVDKIRRYETTANVGPWRHRTLWITNEEAFSQQVSDQLAAGAAESGFVAARVYPEHGESGSSNRIVEALDEGQFLVYFYGHGGRFIWRTSPRDLKKTRDLFTLDDLDRLAPTDRYPVVLSFTCSSAPFDHPSEDSIGEKFLRVEERGAVAFIGASWRNAPSAALQEKFVNAFSTHATVGEAFMAVRDDDLRGAGVLEWIAEDGTSLLRTEFRAEHAEFTVRAGDSALGALSVPARVHCYVWDERTGRNGVGVVEWPVANGD